LIEFTFATFAIENGIAQAGFFSRFFEAGEGQCGQFMVALIEGLEKALNHYKNRSHSQVKTEF